jgi:hypothetical protein
MDTTIILPIYYKCDVCGYTSILKANYDRHMMTKKHLKNIEKHIDKVEAEKILDKDSESDGEIDDTYISPVKNNIFYGNIYNTLFELKRQYPNKYEFVRNTERMKREWKRWTQEKYDNDMVYCYTKWFKKLLQVNRELVSKFVY